MLILFASAALILSAASHPQNQTDDLALMYPAAQSELTEFLSCYVGYIKDHKAERVSDKTLWSSALLACQKSEGVLAHKVDFLHGDYLNYIFRLNSVIYYKIGRIRSRAASENISPR